MSKDIAMFKTSDRASFLIIFFLLLQYNVFVVLSSNVFCPFPQALSLRLLHQRRKSHTKPTLHSKPLGNYWVFAVFSGPDLITTLSDVLKKIDTSFITCDDIGKLHFVTSLKHLKQLFGHFNPLSVLLISQQMWHPSCKNLSDFHMLLQNMLNR